MAMITSYMDCLSPCQAYPGAAFKTGGKFRKLEVTQKSMLLHIRHVIADHEKSAVRKKISKRDWLEVAEWAALADALARDVVSILGFTAQEVEAAFIEPLANATDPQLLLEIQSIITERPEVINLERISVIRDMSSKRAVNSKVRVGGSFIPDGDSVEDISWSCVVNDVKHDIQAMKIFQQQQSSYDRAIYFSELETRRQIETESRTILKSFMDANCLMVPFDQEQGVKKFLSYVVSICSKPQVKTTDAKLAINLIENLGLEPCADHLSLIEDRDWHVHWVLWVYIQLMNDTLFLQVFGLSSNVFWV